MNRKVSEILEWLSNYLATRKGLLPITGFFFVLINLVIVILFPDSWAARYNISMHFGILIAILGFMIAKIL
ncbi:MAG TPA: hypothetical protein VN226_08985 [Anaerolineales bacterium]|nr:hypothetical protein [Anaerolineales bacterium]